MNPRTAVVSCMKNEGQFLLEWVAFYRVLGFDEILVLTNDCQDGTDAMLQYLQDIGEVTHVQNPREGDEPPQVTGLRRAFRNKKVRSCDWMLHCDADEFLRIDYGNGHIQDLLAAMPGHTDAIAIAWMPYGHDDLAEWPGGNVIEANTRRQSETDPGGFHKSLYRPNKFSAATDHMPKRPYGPVTLRNAAGTEMDAIATRTEHAKFRGNGPEMMSWDGAALHHYAIRADDIFMMKNARGDGMAFNNSKYFLNSGFYRRFNKNEVTDTALHRQLPALQAKLDQYRSMPELAALEAQARQWYLDLKSRVLTPEQAAKWTKT